MIFALYKEAQKADYFWIDDIHITGTLTAKLNLSITDIEHLVISPSNFRYIVENDYNVSDPFLYGRANMEEKEIRALWEYALTHAVPKHIFTNFKNM